MSKLTSFLSLAGLISLTESVLASIAVEIAFWEKRIEIFYFIFRLKIISYTGCSKFNASPAFSVFSSELTNIVFFNVFTSDRIGCFFKIFFKIIAEK